MSRGGPDLFAGIVRGTGKVLAFERRGRDGRLVVDCSGVDLGDAGTGASVAVNGVCLTALAPVGPEFAADVSRETLAVTTLGSLAAGDRVNLEPSLRLGEPVDGHLVYGHVDATATVGELASDGRSTRLGIDLESALMRYVATKGSVAIDGVSLTVNRVEPARFEVNVIPHTAEITIVGSYAVGTTVNIEVDMMARYAERLATPGGSSLSIDTLREHGFTGND